MGWWHWRVGEEQLEGGHYRGCRVDMVEELEPNSWQFCWYERWVVELEVSFEVRRL